VTTAAVTYSSRHDTWHLRHFLAHVDVLCAEYRTRSILLDYVDISPTTNRGCYLCDTSTEGLVPIQRSCVPHISTSKPLPGNYTYNGKKCRIFRTNV
jgi:hypothetical protein